jgi:hypothetical protein
MVNFELRLSSDFIQVLTKTSCSFAVRSRLNITHSLPFQLDRTDDESGRGDVSGGKHVVYRDSPTPRQNLAFGVSARVSKYQTSGM